MAGFKQNNGWNGGYQNRNQTQPQNQEQSQKHKRSQNQERSVKKLPEGYLDEGYYETVRGEKVLNSKYIVTYPRQIARMLSDNKNKNINKRSQIRKFYDQTLKINELLDRKSGDYVFVKSELMRLIPYAEYARSREKVSDLFRDFIEKNVNAVQNADDMRAFVKHFEALVAYLPKDRN